MSNNSRDIEVPARLSQLLLAPEETQLSLKKLMTRAEPPQALLLTGGEGLGKESLAQAMAARWLCRKPDPEGACGACESCLKWSGSQHPDLYTIAPSPDQIKIEQIREARQWMNFAPVVAPFRAIIILQAETLNLHAANALLKTLEEPPENYFFLLTSNGTDSILPTVLSRCRIARLAPIEIPTLSDWLKSEWGLEAEKAQQIAEYAAGAPGKALEWARALSEEKEAPFLKGLDQMLNCLETLSELEPFAALRAADEFRDACKQLEAAMPSRSSRFALAKGLELLIEWYRDTLSLDHGASNIHFQSRLDALNRLRKRFPAQKRSADLEQIIDIRRYVLGNANAQIATESLFIRLLSNIPIEKHFS